MRVLLSIFALAFLCVEAGSARADNACQLSQVASLPLKMDGNGIPFTTIKIHGKDVNLGLQPTQPRSVLTYASVGRLGLSTLPIEKPTEALEGRPINRGAIADRVEMGAWKPQSLDFMIFPAAPEFPSLDGWLGLSILAGFDVEFDFAGGKLNLFDQRHCGGEVTYWTHDPPARIILGWDTSEYQSPALGRTTAELDGKQLTAFIDPASPTIINLAVGMKIFDLRKGDPRLIPVADVKGFKAYRFPFKSIALDGITITNPDIVLLDDETGFHEYDYRRDVPLVIGISVLKKLHLYYAFSEGALYATGATAR